MRNTFFSILLIWLALFAFASNTIAQDSPQWHLPEGVKVRLGKGRINEIAYSPDGDLLAVASFIGIWLYDARTGEELKLLSGHTSSVKSVSFSPDGSTLASGSLDATVRLWSVETGRHLRTLSGHTSWVYSVSYSPDGLTLASGSFDDTVRLWSVETGRHLRTLSGHASGVYSVSYSPDGLTLASGSWQEIRLWSVETGRHLRTLSGHTSWVNSVSYSPDGSTLASGSDDTTVRLWSVGTGRHLRTLGHTGWVWSVSYSPDGLTLASGSWQEIHLWSVETGRHLRTLSGHTRSVNSVSYSPDGLTLASASWDGTVFLWELAPTPPASKQIAADVNKDGIVNIIDLTLVASNFGKTGQNSADVNSDGVVNIIDLTLVAGAFGTTAGAPSMWNLDPEIAPTRTQVEQWLREARQMNLTDSTFQRGILILEQLLASLTPKETALLPNYPNPFNPETWIPYRLAESAKVSISIYAADGKLVRTLDLGDQPMGMYESRSRAAYWDGRNALGEPVASGVYFYTLTAGDFTATRKMLIRK